jgi:predicted MFS family arabinose efflux permease
MPADLLTSWAFEMEMLVLGWYVMVSTGSVLMLTAFASLQQLGTLAAPMFGVMGDRLGGRTMLCAMRATFALLAAFMMVMALWGLLTPAWVFAVAALTGVVRPNDQVMRNALIGETIPPAHLVGALGMSRATMDSARVAGALAGAGLSTALGMGVTYAFVASFYVASLALTMGVSRRPMIPVAREPARGGVADQTARALPRSSRWRDLRDGLAHVLRTPELLALMWLAFLINLTAYPASSGLLPYVAREVYRVDATGLGWLVASFALGGLVASMVMVTTGGSRRPERSTLVHSALWYALLLGFGHLQGIGPGLLTLFAAGFVQNVAMISMAATLLASAGEGFRGRVMGVRTLAVYGMPLGLVASGALIERNGYPLTITAAAAVGLACTALIGFRWRASLWQREQLPAAATSAPQRV